MESYYIKKTPYLGYLVVQIDIDIWNEAFEKAINVYDKEYDYDTLVNRELINLTLEFLKVDYFHLASLKENLKEPVIIDIYISDVNDGYIELEYYTLNKLRFEVSELFS